MILKTPSKTPLDKPENITNLESQLQLNLNQDQTGLRSIEWAAGLFEGEGSITHQSYKTNKPRLNINMSDLDVLEYFVEAIDYKGKILGPYKTNGTKNKPTHLPAYYVCITKKSEVKRVLKLFLPFFGKRRRQRAEQALYQLQ